MSFLRPEVGAALNRWREVIAALGLAAAGLWLATRGGWLLVPLGGAAVALALGWGVVALRRLRFRRVVADPGVVEVDEGQIGYFGPDFGGFLPIAELVEVRLTERDGRRQWRLRASDAQVLTIPVAARGAERLFDAFAALPGIDMAALLSAMDATGQGQPVWTRPASRLAGS